MVTGDRSLSIAVHVDKVVTGDLFCYDNRSIVLGESIETFLDLYSSPNAPAASLITVQWGVCLGRNLTIGGISRSRHVPLVIKKLDQNSPIR